MNNKKLVRSQSNKMIAGVCGGLGEYLSVDPTVIRVIFILLTLTGGAGIIMYLILIFIMPAETTAPVHTETAQSNSSTQQTHTNSVAPHGSERSMLFGLLLIVVGLLFFLRELFPRIFDIDSSQIWAIVIILIGLYLLLRNAKQS
jgi:phage shock protein C